MLVNLAENKTNLMESLPGEGCPDPESRLSGKMAAPLAGSWWEGGGGPLDVDGTLGCGGPPLGSLGSRFGGGSRSKRN